MRRSLPILLGLGLLLSACGSTSTTATCDTEYWDSTIATCLPEGWTVLDEATLVQRGVPEEVFAAFQATTAVSGQFPTVTVTREPLRRAMTSTEYSDQSVNSVTSLPGYTLVDRKTVTIGGEKVTIHTFTARPVAEQPAHRFLQLSAAHGDAGFTFTAALPLSVSDSLEKQVLLILEHVAFEQPTKE